MQSPLSFSELQELHPNPSFSSAGFLMFKDRILLVSRDAFITFGDIPQPLFITKTTTKVRRLGPCARTLLGKAQAKR